MALQGSQRHDGRFANREYAVLKREFSYREVGCSSPPRPTVAKMACTDLLLYNAVPITVPSVFVMRSVMPESRVGRKACNTSIVRLIAAPRRIVASTAW